MRESVFSSRFRKELPMVLYDYEEEIPHVVLLQDSYNSGKKPYDFYFVYKGDFYAIECKVCNGLSINFSQVLKNQITSLLDVKLASHGKNNKALIAFLLTRFNNSILFVPVNVWVQALHHYSGDKSVKIKKFLDDFKEKILVVERGKHTAYDFKQEKQIYSTYWHFDKLVL